MPMDSPQKSSSDDTPQLPEVIVDGVKVAPGGQEILGEIYDLINMANLNKIRRYYDDISPEGESRDDTLQITDVLYEYRLETRVISVAITNNGPNPVNGWVNRYTENRGHIIAFHGTWTVNFDKHLIDRIYLQCDAGNTATVLLSYIW